MKVVVINGVAKSGKDEFVKIVTKLFPSHIVNMSTINPVKDALKCLGWDGISKTDLDRLFMSKLKQIWIELYDGPFNYIVTSLGNDKLLDYDICYFVHCREPEEIKKLKNYYEDDCITLLIKRDGLEIPDNLSDNSVENYQYDYIVDNSGTLEDLEKEVLLFIERRLS